MEFFTAAIGSLQTLVVALGAGLGIWGVINLLEGYGNDNRATRSYLKRLRTSQQTIEMENRKEFLKEGLGELIFRWVK